ncbi:MAG TPA: folylpolyglutamate synthase/dihydrofolate synthase family protein, partial [Hyphomicrobiaceae bacterium]|nr:folylpolyglutamate synthase/dihydrofolate synthase family protein [Hyphomicrobiaceae bacterium]
MASLDALLAQLKTLHPKLIDLSLDRSLALLEKLGRPQTRLPPVVHVAGTNGKGSTTAYLASMLQAAGKRVHVYTSPHLVRFNERIAVAGPDGHTRPIDEDRLAGLLLRVAKVNAGRPITFFEITTVAAFLAFSEIPADALILEVGLGGRFDATNVIDRPRLSVITSISMYHAERLGDTVEKIAFEKAGILKPGVTAVVSQQPASVHEVIEECARALGSPVVSFGRDFDAYAQGGRLVVQFADRLLDLPLPALVGRHQVINAGTAVAAASELGDLGLTEAAIASGLTSAAWPARMQRLTHPPLLAALPAGSELWLDGGHNPGAGEMLAQTLADLEEKSSKPLHLIVAM